MTMPRALDELHDLASAKAQRVIAAADAASGKVAALLDRGDLSTLNRHNRGFDGFDWRAYLIASRIRIVHACLRLDALGLSGGRVLDQGALFGNFSLAMHMLGYVVVAGDAYEAMGSGLGPWVELLRAEGVEVVDNDLATHRLPYASDRFDAAISMGVIEHIPSTPRLHFQELVRVLKPNAPLVVETPNLAYQAKRMALAEGRSVFQSIQSQFWSEIPFSGHHREYTASELAWMLAQSGFQGIDVGSYDYSYLSVPALDDAMRRDLAFRRANPDQQELLLAWGRKIPPACHPLPLG